MKKTDGKFHSAIIPDARLLQGILGLRGIAAFAVVLFHVRHLTGIHVPEAFHFIERDFGYAPQLFFVLSAFSLMHSTSHTMHRPGWVREYLVKRLFRIAPLFYVVLAYMLLRSGYYSIYPDVSTILLNVFFIFGLLADSAVSLVWAGWTVGVEMIFYALFPVLLMAIRTKRQALVFLLAAMLASYVARAALHTEYLNTVPAPRWDMSHFMFLPNLYFFAVGIFAYKVDQEFVTSGKPLPALIPLFAVIAIGTQWFAGAGQPFYNSGRLDLIILASGFGALCIWQSSRPSKWSANGFFEYLGERSFSVYLLHPVVIVLLGDKIVRLYAFLEPGMGRYAYFVCALAVMGVLLSVVEITYRAIEIPGINQGRRIIARMRAPAPQRG